MHLASKDDAECIDEPRAMKAQRGATEGAAMNWIGAIFVAALVVIAFALYSDMTMTRCAAGSFAATVGLCTVAK
jgi:hypothetical protein